MAVNPREVVLASGNQGKLAELQLALQDLGWRLCSQRERGVTDADETASTFVENALIKARHASLQTGLPAIADDSGLVVPALGGAPGIYSARYSGSGDGGNNQKLLEEMAHLQGTERDAYFICVLVFMHRADDPVPIIAEGRWQGRIALAPRGEQGFGYDPLFQPEGSNHHAAELSPADKAAYSHRGIAVRQLRAALAR
jgi:XTP/dITP diphosphohydrolase